MVRLPMFTLLAALFLVVPALAGGKTIIVLDASGSMWGQIDGTTKIEIARDTLRQVLGTISDDTELGLVAYGHREKGSCSDIEIAVPPGSGTAAAITAFADRINPKGKTPLTQAVRVAAQELRIEENEATVILVTDGLETCNADPCALGKELEATGVNFTTHVVGFGLSDEDGRQVACLAENTGGLYLKAADAGQLAEALTATVAKAPEPAPEPQPAALDSNFKGIARLAEDGPDLPEDAPVRWDLFAVGANGEPETRSAAGGYGGVFEDSLPAGRYLTRVKIGNVMREFPAELADDRQTELPVVLDAGFIRITPKRTADGEADDSARIDIAFEGASDGGYGPTEAYVAAGPVTVTGKIDKSKAETSFTVRAGETVEADLVIASGIVVPAAVYAQGGPAVEGDSIRFEVREAKADIAGKRDTLAGQYGPGRGMNVPPGDYLLHARLGQTEATAPITVEAGKRTEATINIDAGVLAIAAPGAYRIDIFGARKDIQGKQVEFGGTYGGEMQETLNPGEYEVRVTYEGDKAEKRQKAVVTAGERTELAVE
ncbi:VWA domain-containing protein [Nitratireductor sp. ZSWI3]|uniref:vWA domain-containing protein n=1 Tax=Nitratireductor sp. ZSWI3 TaxID=2966359 RepID=UPI00214FDB93|nr:VWA domain-containing protein [Nitratireductor sp. ZSWI3]MCR4266763.1 VWA domain-containing protein [Nitratireductor sp. ZSWI3]